MMRVTIPVDAGNDAIRSGRLPQLFQEVMGKMQPESAYFTADGGSRTAYIVFDMKDSSDIPGLAEPFFMELMADVEFMPVMNAEDLKKGLARIATTV
jgi:hypothetical protein